MEKDIFYLKYIREKKSREEAEFLLETKSLELHQKNHDLQSLTDNLQELIELNTRDLKNARDKALSADQEKSLFLAVMSHEIRTPLNAILNLSEILVEEPGHEDKEKFMSIINDSANTLLSTIDDVLNYSKLESGELDIIRKNFNLKAVCKHVIEMTKAITKSKPISVLLKIRSHIPDVLQGDATLLRQVLINLLSNAVKFTQKGSISLVVDSKSNEGESWVLSFKIVDTGVGISQKDISQIFEPYSKTDQSNSRESGSVGLGLPYCKSVVEQMGGVITVTSTPSQGSIFTCTIPFQVLNSDDIDSAELKDEFYEFTNAKILVVEDSIANQAVASAILKKQGYDVKFADNGKLALEQLENEEFDLILMDVRMPVMNGIEATKMIRHANKAFRSVPILALTANALDKELMQCIEAGMNDTLTKPIIKKELLSKIKEYLFKVE